MGLRRSASVFSFAVGVAGAAAVVLSAANAQEVKRLGLPDAPASDFETATTAPKAETRPAPAPSRKPNLVAPSDEPGIIVKAWRAYEAEQYEAALILFAGAGDANADAAYGAALSYLVLDAFPEAASSARRRWSSG